MAEAVAGNQGPRPPGPGSLVDMSLVGAEPEPGPEPGRSYATGRLGPGTFWVWGMRYRMLETVQEYAAERLVAAGSRTRPTSAWPPPVWHWPSRPGRGDARADQGAWLARLEREHDNFRPC